MTCSCGQEAAPNIGNCAPCFKMAMASQSTSIGAEVFTGFISIGAEVFAGFMLMLIPFLMASVIHHLLAW